MVEWPQEISPANSPVHVRNELAIAAPPAAVWAVLVRASAWPSWYRQCRDVRLDGGGDDLTAGASFRWRTVGQSIRSQVKVFDPVTRLAWDAHNPRLRVLHAWEITETPTGCTVVTEECQQGLLPWTTRLIARRLMLRAHQEWLVGLAAQALPAG
jgi:uncharacterized protein YndB with AHSA1/START domain